MFTVRTFDSNMYVMVKTGEEGSVRFGISLGGFSWQ